GYAIVLVEALLDRPQPVAVPVSVLQNVQGKLQLRLNPKQFELASSFDEQRWLSGGNQPAEVFKFSK
ncbi:MAG TPA: hypothetical protein VHI52_03785, partial [Verrucomicrobiae bacterium]|nr:hypothetical protein [Verrucomicrobiae bacterium]